MRISDWSSDVCSSDLQLAALPPNEAEQRRAGLAAAQRDDERAHVGQLDRADEMVAIEKEGGILDLVKGARREDEGGAGAIDFLPNLARRLSVGIKVLEREGELAVDMAIILALLLGDRLGRQLFGIIIYRAVQRISAIFGEQHPRRGRSEEHTSELQSLMRISYAVFCLKKKTHIKINTYVTTSITYYAITNN